MGKIFAAALALGLALSSAAWAQVCPAGSTCTPFETYVYGQSAATAPYGSGLRIPAAPSGSASSTVYIPGNVLVTLTDAQTLSGKTLTSPTINGGALSGTLSGAPTFSGNIIFGGIPNFTGILTGTIAAGGNLGLDAGGNLVKNTVSGSATPGGTSGQIQWNNSGSFAGFTASGDFTINTSTGVGTIANNAVTLAKQATNTANTLQGFDGSGNAADITVGSGLSLSEIGRAHV